MATDRDKKIDAKDEKLETIKKKLATLEELSKQMMSEDIQKVIRKINDPDPNKREFADIGEVNLNIRYQQIQTEMARIAGELEEDKAEYFPEKFEAIKRILLDFQSELSEDIKKAIEKQDKTAYVTTFGVRDMLLNSSLNEDFKYVKYGSFMDPSPKTNAAIQKIKTNKDFRELINKYVYSVGLLRALVGRDKSLEQAYVAFKQAYNKDCQTMFKQTSANKKGIEVAAKLDEQIKLIDQFATTQALVVARKAAAQKFVDQKKEETAKQEAKVKADQREGVGNIVDWYKFILDQHISFLYRKDPEHVKKIDHKFEPIKNDYGYEQGQAERRKIELKQRETDFKEITEGEMKKFLRTLEVQAAIMEIVAKKMGVFKSEVKADASLQENAGELKTLLDRKVGEGDDMYPFAHKDQFKGKTYREMLETPIPTQYRNPANTPTLAGKFKLWTGQAKTHLALFLDFVDKNAPKPKVEAAKDAKAAAAPAVNKRTN